MSLLILAAETSEVAVAEGAASSGASWGWIVALALCIGLVIALAVTAALSMVPRAAGNRLDALLGADAPVLRRSTRANGFGNRRRGALQVRGNGGLALTADELVFAMLLPQRVTRVPLRDVTDVTVATSHLGKTVFRPLLKVAWTADEGADDMAWWVEDADGWADAVREAARAARSA